MKSPQTNNSFPAPPGAVFIFRGYEKKAIQAFFSFKIPSSCKVSNSCKIFCTFKMSCKGRLPIFVPKSLLNNSSTLLDRITVGFVSPACFHSITWYSPWKSGRGSLDVILREIYEAFSTLITRTGRSLIIDGSSSNLTFAHHISHGDGFNRNLSEVPDTHPDRGNRQRDVLQAPLSTATGEICDIR